MTKTASGIRIGRKRNNGRLALHLSIDGATCRTDRRINVEAETLSTKARRCKSCFTPARIALAKTVNNSSDSRWDADVDKFLAAIGPQTTLAQILNRPGRDAELAAIAAAHAAVLAPVEVETVPEPVEAVKPSFASVMAGLGGRHNGAHYDHAARRLARRHLANAA